MPILRRLRSLLASSPFVLAAAAAASAPACTPNAPPSADAADASAVVPATLPKTLTVAQANACALAACRKLVAANVASGCHLTTEHADTLTGFAAAAFRVVGGFPRDQGEARCYVSETDYAHGDAANLDPKTLGISDDDYPVQSAASAKTRTSFTWSPADPSSSKWHQCRQTKTPGECAQAMPAEYAHYKALYEAAKLSVSGG